MQEPGNAHLGAAYLRRFAVSQELVEVHAQRDEKSRERQKFSPPGVEASLNVVFFKNW